MGSVIMPVLVVAALAKMRLSNWILAGAGVAAYLLAHAPHRLNSLSFMFDFALGAWLASGKLRWCNRGSPTRFFAATLTLIFFRFLWFSIRFGHPMQLYGYDDPLPMLVEGIAAAFLIGDLAAEHGQIRWLRSRWAVRLGDLSYSLYLIHFPVALALAKFLSLAFAEDGSAIRATAFLMVLGVPISFGLALLIYRLVELPSIELGKRIVNRSIASNTPVSVG